MHWVSQARKLLAETPPDALLEFILMVVNMPGTTDFQWTRALTRDAHDVHIPKIMVTAKIKKLTESWRYAKERDGIWQNSLIR